MLVANMGLRGVDVLEEVYEQLEVESFFDRGVDSAGNLVKEVPASGCLHLVRQELAVVDVVQQTWVTNVGTSGLDRSVALFLACEDLSRVGLVHVDSVEAAEWATTRLAREVGDSLSLQQAVSGGDGGGSSSEPGSPGPGFGSSTRRRKGPLVEAFIVGGFEDDEGVCEGIIRAILAGLAESEHRIRLSLVCAGRINDSQHNGNEEDRKGPRCALVTACTLHLRREKRADRLRFEAIPVPGFQHRGPAHVLRNVRTLLGESPLAAQSSGKRSRSPKHRRMLGKSLVNRAFSADSGRFVINPFRYTGIDRQSAAVLLHTARADPKTFLARVNADYVAPPNIERFLRDACEVIRFVVANPNSAAVFASGVPGPSGEKAHLLAGSSSSSSSSSSSRSSSDSREEEDEEDDEDGVVENTAGMIDPRGGGGLVPIAFARGGRKGVWAPCPGQHANLLRSLLLEDTAAIDGEVDGPARSLHPHDCVWRAISLAN